MSRVPEDATRELLVALGEDPSREGLIDTPRRMVKALREMTSGYRDDPSTILSTTFPADGYDEMVVLRGVAFTSLCEHHVLPFQGRAHLGYVPGPRVVGLSKLARLVECRARRLQVQERLTRQIADDIAEYLSPLGVGVVVEARHECMACRGVRKDGATMVTSTMLGALRASAAARSEFLSMCRVGEP